LDRLRARALQGGDTPPPPRPELAPEAPPPGDPLADEAEDALGPIFRDGFDPVESLSVMPEAYLLQKRQQVRAALLMAIDTNASPLVMGSEKLLAEVQAEVEDYAPGVRPPLRTVHLDPEAWDGKVFPGHAYLLLAKDYWALNRRLTEDPFERFACTIGGLQAGPHYSLNIALSLARFTAPTGTCLLHVHGKGFLDTPERRVQFHAAHARYGRDVYAFNPKMERRRYDLGFLRGASWSEDPRRVLRVHGFSDLPETYRNALDACRRDVLEHETLRRKSSTILALQRNHEVQEGVRGVYTIASGISARVDLELRVEAEYLTLPFIYRIKGLRSLVAAKAFDFDMSAPKNYLKRSHHAARHAFVKSILDDTGLDLSPWLDGKEIRIPERFAWDLGEALRKRPIDSELLLRIQPPDGFSTERALGIKAAAFLRHLGGVRVGKAQPRTGAKRRCISVYRWRDELVRWVNRDRQAATLPLITPPARVLPPPDSSVYTAPAHPRPALRDHDVDPPGVIATLPPVEVEIDPTIDAVLDREDQESGPCPADRRDHRKWKAQRRNLRTLRAARKAGGKLKVTSPSADELDATPGRFWTEQTSTPSSRRPYFKKCGHAFLNFDLSNAHILLAGEAFGDRRMIEDGRSGTVYEAMAAQGGVTRDQAKGAMVIVLNGGGVETLVREQAFTTEQATSFVELFGGRYPTYIAASAALRATGRVSVEGELKCPVALRINRRESRILASVVRYMHEHSPIGCDLFAPMYDGAVWVVPHASACEAKRILAGAIRQAGWVGKFKIGTGTSWGEAEANSVVQDT
jgi:hypothetical protein